MMYISHGTARQCSCESIARKYDLAVDVDLIIAAVLKRTCITEGLRI